MTERAPEQEPERIPLSTHSTFLLCVVMVVAFGVWSSQSTLDIVSMATGEVIPSTQVKTIQHLEGGIVRQILVNEGVKVKAGQSLVVLEPTAGEADVAELLVRLTSLQGDIAQLEALEKGSSSPTFPKTFMKAPPDLVRQATRRFETRLKRRDDDLKKQDQAVQQREQALVQRGQAVIQREQAVIKRKEEVKEISIRISGNKESLKIVSERIGISDELLKDKLTNKFQHLQLLNEAQQIKNSIGADTAGLAGAKASLREARASLQEAKASSQEAKASLREAKATRNSLLSQFEDENQEALEEARLSFGELNERIKKFEDSLQRTTVRSPIDGVIKTLHVITIGGVLRPGDPVVDIVPTGDKLIIEAQLPTQDIGHVAVGQVAEVKLASADAMRYGSLIGSVTHVSPDTLVTPEGAPFYKVRIALGQSFFERGKYRHELFPGMQVMTSIQTGERTVLQYLIDPVMFRLGDAMQER